MVPFNLTIQLNSARFTLVRIDNEKVILNDNLRDGLGFKQIIQPMVKLVDASVAGVVSFLQIIHLASHQTIAYFFLCSLLRHRELVILMPPPPPYVFLNEKPLTIIFKTTI